MQTLINHTTAMNDFTKELRVDEALLRFDFMRVYTVSGPRYYVAVADKRHKVYLFQMQQKDGQWRIVDAPKVPGWIHAVEEELQKAIAWQE